MMTRTEILNLIENADPADSAALDDIEAHVWWFLQPKYSDMNGWEVLKACDRPRGIVFKMPCGETTRRYYGFPKYTRSRDALKAIRPEGWYWNAGCNASDDGWFISSMYRKYFKKVLNSHVLPTEELAELHAIIQAIAYERANDEL